MVIAKGEWRTTVPAEAALDDGRRAEIGGLTQSPVYISLVHASEGGKKISESFLAHAAMADMGIEQGAIDGIANSTALASPGNRGAHGQSSVS